MNPVGTGPPPGLATGLHPRAHTPSPRIGRASLCVIHFSRAACLRAGLRSVPSIHSVLRPQRHSAGATNPSLHGLFPARRSCDLLPWCASCSRVGHTPSTSHASSLVRAGRGRSWLSGTAMDRHCRSFVICAERGLAARRVRYLSFRSKQRPGDTTLPRGLIGSPAKRSRR